MAKRKGGRMKKTDGFEQTEQEFRAELDRLFDAWNNRWEEYRQTHPDAHGVSYDTDIIPDGFFPGYLQQKKKILFIGREIADFGGNYIDVFTDQIRKGKANRFHRRMLLIACGLLHKLDWIKIPGLAELRKGDKIFHEFSFAFMNLTKISNDSGSKKTDWKLMKTSIEMSVSGDRNFILEEISCLDPDVIITMNLSENGMLQEAFGDRLTHLKSKDFPCLAQYLLSVKPDKRILLLDSYHYSNPRISNHDEGDMLYTPVFNAMYQQA